jgi:two-component system LytT family response regulator
MELRAILIDDEQRTITALRLLIAKYLVDLRVVGSSTSASEGIDLIEDYKPEVVFLDINMPEMSGFEVLEKLQWKDFKLVFVTAHQEFAIEALKKNAVDYLLKPVDHNDLISTVQRIKSQLQQNKQGNMDYLNILDQVRQERANKIMINTRIGVDSIDKSDLISLKSDSNYTVIHLKNREPIVASRTLKEFESLLCTEELKFMRVHVSYIINLTNVSRYLKSSEIIVMVNDQKIPLSKSRKQAFFDWFEIYM